MEAQINKKDSALIPKKTLKKRTGRDPQIIIHIHLSNVLLPT